MRRILAVESITLDGGIQALGRRPRSRRTEVRDGE
jgi:hypothetical protein